MSYRAEQAVTVPLLIAAVLVSGHAVEAAFDPATNIRKLTGAHTRVVWSMDVSGADESMWNRNDSLMGFDSDDGKGARRILPYASSFCKPLFTSDGNRIVYTSHQINRTTDTLRCVNWDGTGERTIGLGFASCVRRIGGKEWVYARINTPNNLYAVDTIYRFNLDNPSERQVVWSKTRVDMEKGYQLWFSASADGKKAIGTFPWNASRFVSLPNGTMDSLPGACWPAMSPDTVSYRWFLLAGGHENVMIGQGPTLKRDAAGGIYRIYFSTTLPDYDSLAKIDSKGAGRVYWPRWTNHPQFFVLGHPQAPMPDIWIGKFNANFDSVAGWARVTHNLRYDAAPDCWIDPGSIKPTLPAPSMTPEAQSFSGSLVVTITTAVQGGQIRYTIDGTRPSSTSPVYTVPLTLTKTTTVQAMVLKEGSDPSPITNRTYTYVSGFVLTSLKISPVNPTVARNGQLQLTATAYDQFGKPLSPQPTATWSATGGNTITTGGLLTAGAAAGTYIVKASATLKTVTKSDSTSLTITSAPLTLVKPNGGEVFKVGDTIIVKWSADMSQVSGVIIRFSADAGRTWAPLSTLNSIKPADPEWNNFRWVVASTLFNGQTTISTVSTRCLVNISDYFKESELQDASDAAFTITTSSKAKDMAKHVRRLPFSYRLGGSLLTISTDTSVRRILVLSVDGSIVFSGQNVNGERGIYCARMAPGAYVIAPELASHTASPVTLVVH